MKVLIIEDETIASQYVSDQIRKIDPAIRVAGITESISQTVKWLKANPAPDLLFMDIHLSDGSAFSIFDLISVDIPIIFTTAFDEYAIHAFKVNSIDYLLKPVAEDDLRRAIAKFRKFTSYEKEQYLARQSMVPEICHYNTKLLVSYRDSLIPLSVGKIVYFYTSDHQTFICLEEGKTYMYNKTLDSIIHNLNPKHFFRANKQFIIAREHVKNITIWFDRRLLVTLSSETPERIYVSKNRSTEFKEWIVNGH